MEEPFVAQALLIQGVYEFDKTKRMYRVIRNSPSAKGGYKFAAACSAPAFR